MTVTLSDLLKKMLELNGSDLHITTNSPPQVQIGRASCRERV